MNAPLNTKHDKTEALYIVPVLARYVFVWAHNANEARERADALWATQKHAA